MSPKTRTLAVSLAAVSFALVLMELLITRLFGVILFAQFAHLALALALMGIGVGAVLQHLRPSLVPDQGLEQRVAVLSLIQAGLSLLAVLAALNFPIVSQFEAPPESYQERSGIVDNLVDPWWFAALLPVLAAPFTAAGLIWPAGPWPQCSSCPCWGRWPAQTWSFWSSWPWPSQPLC